jgi:DEAD/DEAH box helicase domain-containing protein
MLLRGVGVFFFLFLFEHRDSAPQIVVGRLVIGAAILGPAALDGAALLPVLVVTAAGGVGRGRDTPAARVSLRSGDPTAFVIVDEESGAVLGTSERERAFSTVHAGAVYLHLGDQYAVSALDLESRAALVRPVTVDWYTQARKETRTEIAETLRSRRVAGVELFHGRIAVTEQVIGFQRKAIADGGVIDTTPLDLPETFFETEGVWFCPAEWLLEGIDTMPTLVSALHAAEHALISLLPLFAMCDRWDIGGLSTNVHEQTGLPTIFVYEGHAGGVGITERGFDCFAEWAGDTARLLERCPCRAGCPSCVQSPKCGNLNELLDKGAALTLLGRMTG